MMATTKRKLWTKPNDVSTKRKFQTELSYHTVGTLRQSEFRPVACFLRQAHRRPNLNSVVSLESGKPEIKQSFSRKAPDPSTKRRPSRNSTEIRGNLFQRNVFVMSWLEAMPPLVIITVALAAMGSLQAAVHRGFNDGKVRLRQPNDTICALERKIPLTKRATSSFVRTGQESAKRLLHPSHGQARQAPEGRGRRRG